MSLRTVWVLGLSSGCGSVAYYGDLSDPEADPGTPPESGSGPASTPTGGTSTEPVDPTEPLECEWTETPPPGDVAAADMARPTWLGVGFVGVVEDGRIHDYSVDGTPYSAVVQFDFFDENLGWLCEVVYDASTATPSVASFPTRSGDPLWASFDLVLGDSASTCGLVGGLDVRELYLEPVGWGVGVGPLDELTQPLADAVVESGGDWDGDWAPYTYALYVRSPLVDPGGTAVELSYASSYDKDCDEVLVDGDAVPFVLPSPTGASPLADFVSAVPLVVYVLP